MEEVQQYFWTREAGISFHLPFALHNYHLPPDDLPIPHRLHQKTQSIINHHVEHSDSSLVLNLLSDDAKTHSAEDKYLPALDYYSSVLRRQYHY